MSLQLFSPELKDYWTRIGITLPWAFFFLGMGNFFEGSPCSEDLTSKINFAYNYHLYSSIFIVALIAQRIYRKNQGSNAPKKDIFEKGIKVLEIIQSLNAWVSLIGLLWSFSTECTNGIKNGIMIYVIFQIGLILSPFLKLAYRLWKIKKNQPRNEGQTKLEEARKKKKL